MPKGYPNKKVSIEPQPLNTQELLDEIAELKREKAELESAKPNNGEQGEVMAALAQLISRGASVSPVSLDPSYASFKKKLNQPFTLSEKRKEEIEDLFRDNGEGKLQFQWDSSGAPSITFRRNIFQRIFDPELEMWTKTEVTLTECIHASQDDRTFKNRIKDMLSIKSATK